MSLKNILLKSTRLIMLTALLLPLLLWACHGGNKIEGRVMCDGKGIAGVVVTDGKNVTTTRTNGKYSLTPSEDARFIYISTPAGYEPMAENSVTKFYLPLNTPELRAAASESAPATGRFDFHLKKKELDDTRHGFIAVADPQLWHEKELALLERGVEDIRNTIADHAGIPFHGMGCGDIVFDRFDLYTQYNVTMSATGLSFYNCLGNHDMKTYGRSFETSLSEYEKVFGPTYYSYNVGQIHYVVLNDCFYLGREYFYIGYIEEKQLEWLAKDLSYIEQRTTVVVTLHIPTTLSNADRDGFSYGRISTTVSNHKGLYELLEPFDAHIISGHMHTSRNNAITETLYEHNIPAISGAWWQGPLCTDGTPAGYAVFLAEGPKLTWYYKGTGLAKDEQLHVYTSADDPAFTGKIAANIWNWDPRWTVSLYRGDTKLADMTKGEAVDPYVKTLYSDKSRMDHNWINPSVSPNFFFADWDGPANGLDVVATDRFGDTYRAPAMPSSRKN